MALEHAILVALTERAASGYDLARRFDRSIGFFWQASHQQVYRVLGRMHTDGWVDATTEQQRGRPDRKVYAVTAPGSAELTRWLAEESQVEPLRSEIAVKIRAARTPAARRAVRADVLRHREAHAARLALYEDFMRTDYPTAPAVPDAQLPAYLVLRGGIGYEQSYVDWLDEVAATLLPEETAR